MLLTAVLLVTMGFACASPPSYIKYFKIEPPIPAAKPKHVEAPAGAVYKLSYANYEETWMKYKAEHSK